jgi:5'-phosphate synthase pdxT subunit
MGVGILALQGDFEAHAAALEKRGIEAKLVRTPEEIRQCQALVLPGGESTAMWRLMEGTGIPQAIAEVAATRPVLATCAGVILLATQVENPQQDGLGVLDVTVRRNAYGRQLDSTVLKLRDTCKEELGDEPLEAVFIRAPKITRAGEGVQVLARREGDPVLVRSGRILAATFHPELTDDPRVVDLFEAMLAPRFSESAA